MKEIKAFGRWSVEGIKIQDPGLVGYINLEPKLVPRTFARYEHTKFHKSRTFIIERLMNKLMVPGHKGKKHKITSYKVTGKSQKAYKIMLETLEIIEKQTKQNPIVVVVKAIENSAPREEIVSIEYGGARYPKAVECSPQRRVDLALRHMTQGAYTKAFGSKRSASKALANEIISAYNLDASSNAIKKKLDLERQADAAR
jgi:small subunit ribosomal protein S7